MDEPERAGSSRRNYAHCLLRTRTQARHNGLSNDGSLEADNSHKAIEENVSRWTAWRRIAEHGHWYDDALDWDGPACYELAVAGPRGGNLHIVYVGETQNEKKRVANYARTGSHLSTIIHDHLRDSW